VGVPVVADFALCHVLEMPEHVREMLVGRMLGQL